MRTARGLDRFTNFTDAVVAIAITLMVLPLVDIVSDASSHDASVTHLISQDINKIFSFLLSFVVIARLWLSHQSIFERVALYDGKVIVSGFLWMLTIVLLPFLTTLIAQYPNDTVAVGLYIGDMTLSSVCLTFMAVLVARNPELRRADSAPGPDELLHGFATTGMFFAVLLVAVFLSSVGLWALYLLFFTDPVIRIVKRLGVSTGILGDHADFG